MSNWYGRLVSETKELSDLLDKLDNFIDNSPLFEKLSTNDKLLLTEQRFYMLNYLNILKKRIESVNNND